jgi:hypothetical protein
LRQAERLEPEVLDLSLTREVVGEEIAGHGDSTDLGAVTTPEETNKKPEQVGVRVRETNAVSILVGLRPEEHAAGEVEAIAFLGPCSALELGIESARSTKGRVCRRACELPWRRGASRVKLGDLLIGELDVPNPETGG